MSNEISNKNSEGYTDNTPHKASKNISSDQERDRVSKLIHTIFYICELAGFRVEGRIALRDKRTNKLWK